jgi:tetratricopeptide (TPR) repeat protein
LDPNSSSILADKGVILLRAGRREEALRLLRQLEQADPEAVSPHRYLRFAYREGREYSEYLSEMKKESLLIHDATLAAVADAAAKGFAARGAKGMFEGQLELEKKAYAQGKISPFFLAQTYSLMGNTEEAMNSLQACFDRHCDETVNLAVDPSFQSLHQVPAFQQLLAKAGLPPVN